VRQLESPISDASRKEPDGYSVELVAVYNKTPDEVCTYMNAADCLLLTSDSEGSPNVIKEAMACNCPIVATDVADIKYMLSDMPGHYILANKKGTPADWVGDESSAEELAELLKKALNF
jgi:glycosyltransferase involved in cell wall biosynthesis